MPGKPSIARVANTTTGMMPQIHKNNGGLPSNNNLKNIGLTDPTGLSSEQTRSLGHHSHPPLRNMNDSNHNKNTISNKKVVKLNSASAGLSGGQQQPVNKNHIQIM